MCMRIVTLLILLYFNLLTYAQTITLNNNEYLKLQDKARSCLYIDIDSSLYYANKIEKSSNTIHKSFSNGLKAYIFQLKNDSLNARTFLKKAYSFLEKTPNSKEKKFLNAYLLNYDGLIEWRKHNLNLALKKYQEGKMLSESVEDIIQVVKFNANIGLINKEIKNYDVAISTFQNSLVLINKNLNVCPKEELNSIISNIHLSISNCYENKFQEKTDLKKIDSAIYHTQKALHYSRDNSLLKLRSLTSLGNIYFIKDDYKNSKKAYQSALTISLELNMLADYNTLLCNLGHLNYYYKKNKEALIYFTKVDSLYQLGKENLTEEYILSNYYLAKIYSFLGKKEQATKFSKKYLDNYEIMVSKEMKETLEVNNTLNNQVLQKEMLDLNEEYKKEKIATVIIYISGLIFIISIILFFRRKNKLKIEKVKNRAEKYLLEIDATKQKNQQLLDEIQNSKEEKRSNASINLDIEKENEIVEMLLSLETKETFLNQDFTQQYVAKKIKTNTTYLSYVVNKRFGKTFSEYANDLKINYSINQMITNPTYRKYNTQAIAESVGFKSAISFRKSFNKKTGVSPTQFLKNIEENSSK
jgi:AraC-like DNA-binding protein